MNKTTSLDDFFAENEKRAGIARQKIMECIERPAPVGSFCRWLCENHQHAYAIWANPANASMMFDAVPMSNLLQSVVHALVDDGDITFFMHGKQPKATFIWEGEDDFENLVLNSMSNHGISLETNQKRAISRIHTDPLRFMSDFKAAIEAQHKRYREFGLEDY